MPKRFYSADNFFKTGRNEEFILPVFYTIGMGPIDIRIITKYDNLETCAQLCRTLRNSKCLKYKNLEKENEQYFIKRDLLQYKVNIHFNCLTQEDSIIKLENCYLTVNKRHEFNFTRMMVQCGKKNSFFINRIYLLIILNL